MLWFALPVLLAAAMPEAHGASLYVTACASCHGVRQWGGKGGPSLRGVGTAVLDFELRTGRMPAAASWIEVEHRDQRSGQQLSLADVRALETYLEPVVRGGPAMPEVIAGHDLARGRERFASDCESCHGTNGEGGDLGGVAWVPALHQASIDVVADAVRAGPAQMPRFSEQQLPQDDLDDLAAYVIRLSVPSAPPPPFRSTGPIPEGAVGYLAVILLGVFAYALWRKGASSA